MSNIAQFALDFTSAPPKKQQPKKPKFNPGDGVLFYTDHGWRYAKLKSAGRKWCRLVHPVRGLKRVKIDDVRLFDSTN